MDHKQQVWFLYVNILGWQYHPGMLRENARKLTNNECFNLAKQATDAFNYNYFKSEEHNL